MDKETIKQWSELEKINSFENCFNTLVKHVATTYEEGITYTEIEAKILKAAFEKVVKLYL